MRPHTSSLVVNKRRVIAAALIIGSTAGLLRCWLALYILRSPYWSTFDRALLDGITTGALVAALLFVTLDSWRRRRRDVLRQLDQVAELNHHVRNALQVITYQTALSKDGQEAVQRVLSAVERIDQTLHRLPHPSRNHDPGP